jgi:hypothetical protein
VSDHGFIYVFANLELIRSTSLQSIYIKKQSIYQENPFLYSQPVNKYVEVFTLLLINIEKEGQASVIGQKTTDNPVPPFGRL